MNRPACATNASTLKASVNGSSITPNGTKLDIWNFIWIHIGLIWTSCASNRVPKQPTRRERSFSLLWLLRETSIYFLQFLDTKCWETMDITMEFCDLIRMFSWFLYVYLISLALLAHLETWYWGCHCQCKNIENSRLATLLTTKLFPVMDVATI